MPQYKCKKDFKKTSLQRKSTLKQIELIDHNLIKDNDLYEVECSDKKFFYKSKVVTYTSCKVKLKDVRNIKTQYFHDYHQALEHFKSKPERFKLWLSKYYKRVSFSLILVIFASVLSYLAVEKNITVVIDGIERSYTTNQIVGSIYADTLADDENLNKYKLSGNEDILKNGSKIDIRTEKAIDLKIMDHEKVFKTYANNLGEFLKELEPNLKNYGDKYSYFVKEHPTNTDKVLIKDMKKLEVFLMSKTISNETVNKKYVTKYVENPKLESGIVKVKQKGEQTKYIKTKEVIYLNNKKYKTNISVTKVISKGQPKIVERGTKAVSPSNSVWDRLAKCETGGRWHLNTGNGFYGGLQFSAPTWNTASAKVGVTAPYAHLASKADQIKAATWLQKNSGWGQWPHCSSKLGLR